MKDLKKAVSMVVTFSLVLGGLSGCGKLAERNEIASGAVKQNEQTAVEKENLQIVKDGQLQILDTHQEGIHAANLTEPKPEEKQVQTYNASNLKDTKPQTYECPKLKNESLQTRDFNNTPRFGTNVLTFNNPNGVALNPHTLSFHGKLSPPDITESFRPGPIVGNGGADNGEQGAGHLCVNSEWDTGRPDVFTTYLGLYLHTQNIPASRIKSIEFKIDHIDNKENIPHDYELYCRLQTSAGESILSHAIPKSMINAGKKLSFLFEEGYSWTDSEEILTIQIIQQSNISCSDGKYDRFDIYLCKGVFSSNYITRTYHKRQYGNCMEWNIVRPGMAVSYYPEPEQEKRLREAEEKKRIAKEAKEKKRITDEEKKERLEQNEKMARQTVDKFGAELKEIINKKEKNDEMYEQLFEALKLKLGEYGVIVNINFSGITVINSAGIDISNNVVKVNKLLEKKKKEKEV